jgi:bacteriocin leader peptide (microcyclamide/patellamide family)
LFFFALLSDELTLKRKRKNTMNKKNITPSPKQPVDRISTGQLSSELAELSEEALHSSQVVPSFGLPAWMGQLNSRLCSYDSDAE